MRQSRSGSLELLQPFARLTINTESAAASPFEFLALPTFFQEERATKVKLNSNKSKAKFT